MSSIFIDHFCFKYFKFFIKIKGKFVENESDEEEKRRSRKDFTSGEEYSPQVATSSSLLKSALANKTKNPKHVSFAKHVQEKMASFDLVDESSTSSTSSASSTSTSASTASSINQLATTAATTLDKAETNTSEKCDDDDLENENGIDLIFDLDNDLVEVVNEHPK